MSVEQGRRSGTDYPAAPAPTVSPEATGARPGGPYDVTQAPPDARERLADFGSLLVPVPEGASAVAHRRPHERWAGVHIDAPVGYLRLHVVAAPRSGQLWAELARDIAASLEQQSRVSREHGPWGTEVVSVSNDGVTRFIGVDGPRWTLYGVCTAGPGEPADDRAEALRAILRGTVVVRGADPLPVSSELPLTNPESTEVARTAPKPDEPTGASQAEPAGPVPVAVPAEPASPAPAEPASPAPAGPVPVAVPDAVPAEPASPAPAEPASPVPGAPPPRSAQPGGTEGTRASGRDPAAGRPGAEPGPNRHVRPDARPPDQARRPTNRSIGANRLTQPLRAARSIARPTTRPTDQPTAGSTTRPPAQPTDQPVAGTTARPTSRRTDPPMAPTSRRRDQRADPPTQPFRVVYATAGGRPPAQPPRPDHARRGLQRRLLTLDAIVAALHRRRELIPLISQAPDQASALASVRSFLDVGADPAAAVLRLPWQDLTADRRQAITAERDELRAYLYADWNWP